MLLPYEMVDHWDRLPKKLMDAPSLETFTVRLDGSLSSMMHSKMSLLIAELLDSMASKSLFQPKLFYESMIL